MSGPLKIACVGEAMIELSLGGETPRLSFAGDTFNTAVYLRRGLAAEHEVAFVSVIGTDPLSDQMAAFIQDQGVSTRCLTRHSDKLPGLYAINTDNKGERSFSYWRENSAARSLFSDGFGVLEGFDVIYLSAITLAILPDDIRARLLDWLETWPGVVAFDSNYRPRLWKDINTARQAVSRAWTISHIGLPSLDDEMALFGDVDQASVLRRLHDCGLQKGALKRGENGPVALDGAPGPAGNFKPATRVVDTTAAGDSFNGAWLAAFIQGASSQESMLAGHTCAVKVIGRRGAIIPAGPLL